MTGRKWTTRDRRIAAALLAAALAAFEWPLLLHPFSSPYGLPGADYAQTLWNFWVTRDALLQGRSPFVTHWLFAGQTASLFYHTLNLFYFVLTAPLYLTTENPFLAYSVSHLAAEALGLLCFYRLVRALGAPRALGVLGSVCFVFSPYALARVTTLNLMSLWLIPLYALCLLRLWRKGRRRDAVALGFVMSLFLVAAWHYLVFCALATPVLVVWFVRRFPCASGSLRRRALCGMLALAVATPAFAFYGVVAVRHAGISHYSPFDHATRIRCSASPIQYAMPGWAQDGWMRAIEPWRRPEVFAYRTDQEHILYMGSVALLLIVWRLARGGSVRRDLATLAGAAIFFVFSLGPVLVIIAPVTVGPDRMLLLPGHWLAMLPVFSSIRHVTRFGVMALFFLLLVACTPADGRGGLWGRSLGRPATLLLVLALLVAHGLDVGPFVKRREAWRPSAALVEALRSEGLPAGPAMILPAYEWQSEAVGMYLQTIHGRGLVAGYLSREPAGGRWGRPEHVALYRELSAAGSGSAEFAGFPALASERLPALLVLHRRRLGDATAEIERYAARRYGYRTAYSDGQIVVMRLHPRGA